MPADPIFADPRLARLYDVFDGSRTDLELYLRLAQEYAARRVLDIGCGTGVLALLLAERGVHVTGVDPASASLDVARAKPGADRVTWVHGDAADVPGSGTFDLAVMTGNVAQSVAGADWPATLAATYRLLRPGGHVVLESRVPARRAWEQWTPARTRQSADVPGLGLVQTWCEVLAVEEPSVTFRWTFELADGETVTSDSTLVFRDLDELTSDLVAAGFAVRDVLDAPDRPGLEHVVVARRSWWRRS